MSKYTPGPWHSAVKGRGTDLGVYTSNGTLIATVQRSGSAISAERRACDARLIAKAPEMVELLRRTVEFVPIELHDEICALLAEIDQ